jgi:hypothetical protein
MRKPFSAKYIYDPNWDRRGKPVPVRGSHSQENRGRISAVVFREACRRLWARDEWIAAITPDVLMWIALPLTETAPTCADDRDRTKLGCGAPADSRGQLGRERALDLGQPAGAEMGIRS